MRRNSLVAERLPLAILFFALTLHAQENQPYPTLAGHITRLASPSDFDVDGIQILVTPATVFTGTGLFLGKSGIRQPSKINLGQSVDIWGKLDRKHHTLSAKLISLVPIATGDQANVSGTGIVDLVPPDPLAKSGTLLLRADGSLILLTARTALNSTLSDPSLNGIHANTWIAYHGIRRPDGTVLADKVSVRPNIISSRENTLLYKTDYDPSQVDPKAKQSALSTLVKGLDPKQVPPYIDAAMQARVDRIGTSLIPAYQKALPESDLTRIDFQFQLVDRDWPDALNLPSGVILVPRQIVERLQNDSQLAVVLADNIAGALEKQLYRNLSEIHALTATDFAGTAGVLVVPPLGIATLAASAGARSNMAKHAMEQSGRVSLTLLNDAGYDITEAPHTWWLLHGKPGQALPDIDVPSRAAYLYQTLATNWPAKTAAP